ncbi:hypothetical protein CPB83DRAFT_862997 [Crepidotus variabilis]|uniref:Extracellular membrane protein CFEM domain-containing protein n=1 Tax=Crepidotus variabilis TaxID=179855 RepID=A0A9P6E6H4_9AGAR|nr:hypothetical protein CPB83DRAFT_862997 [Crepidotus variabilis]
MVQLAQAAALIVLAVPAYAGLIARQVPVDTSDIPASCTSTCQSLVTSVQNGCLNDISCTCSSAFATGLRPCVQCAYDAAPDQFSGTPDQLIQQYSAGCSAAGFPVDGSGSSASGVTGSATGTAIGSVTGSVSGSASATVSVTGASTLTTVKTTAGAGTTSKPTSTGTTSQSTATTSASGGSGSSGSGSGSGSGAMSNTRNVVGITAAVGVIAAWLL